jgi:hypothetical protein
MCGHFQDFPVAGEPHVDQTAHKNCRGASMLSTRFTTGIGGLFVVTTLLIVVQMYTGIEAFPL